MNKIGIVAGGGDLPVLIAKEASVNGAEVYCAAFEGFARPDIKELSASCEFFKLGKIQAPIDFFKKNGVREIILIGNISHINVFRDLNPDLRGASLLLGLKDKSPTGIFRALSKELEKDGLKPADTSMFLKESLAQKGLLAGPKVSQKTYEDLSFAMETASKIASLDIGLSVAVKDKAVIAVEAAEGTDACIKRAGEILGGSKGFVLGKAARPNQDFRFDLPVIGKTTVENLLQAGGYALAVESQKTLIVNKKDTLDFASEKNISIIGF